MRLKAIIPIAVILGLLTPSAGQASDNQPLSINQLSWLAGTWEGDGPTHFDGSERSVVFWTEPLEGVMSWTFRYHTPENGHVHFAYHVIEETDEGVFLRGIHYGRNFENFEETHWTYKMTDASATKAHFICLKNCRGAKDMTLALTNENTFVQTYLLEDETKPPAIFKYARP